VPGYHGTVSLRLSGSGAGPGCTDPDRCVGPPPAPVASSSPDRLRSPVSSAGACTVEDRDSAYDKSKPGDVITMIVQSESDQDGRQSNWKLQVGGNPCAKSSDRQRRRRGGYRGGWTAGPADTAAALSRDAEPEPRQCHCGTDRDGSSTEPAPRQPRLRVPGPASTRGALCPPRRRGCWRTPARPGGRYLD
jgi:hypothetical protein